MWGSYGLIIHLLWYTFQAHIKQTVIEIKDVSGEEGTTGQWVKTDKEPNWIDKAWYYKDMEKYRKHKFNAIRTQRDGLRFDSKKEAAHYDRNKLLIESGAMVFQLRQVPFHLPGGVVYRLDFMEFYTNGDIIFVDVKGRDTAQSKQKRRQVEALYPIEIVLV